MTYRSLIALLDIDDINDVRQERAFIAAHPKNKNLVQLLRTIKESL